MMNPSGRSHGVKPSLACLPGGLRRFQQPCVNDLFKIRFYKVPTAHETIAMNPRGARILSNTRLQQTLNTPSMPEFKNGPLAEQTGSEECRHQRTKTATAKSVDNLSATARIRLRIGGPKKDLSTP
jgi:hypothetical protein